MLVMTGPNHVICRSPASVPISQFLSLIHFVHWQSLNGAMKTVVPAAQLKISSFLWTRFVARPYNIRGNVSTLNSFVYLLVRFVIFTEWCLLHSAVPHIKHNKHSSSISFIPICDYCLLFCGTDKMKFHAWHAPKQVCNSHPVKFHMTATGAAKWNFGEQAAQVFRQRSALLLRGKLNGMVLVSIY